MVLGESSDVSSPSPKLRVLQLPGDTVALILEYLGPRDLSQTKLVCREWKKLADIEQWKHMDLWREDKTLEGLRLRDLSVDKVRWISTRTMSIQYCVDTNKLEQILKLIKGLKELRLTSLSPGIDNSKIFLIRGLRGELQ